jgi:hypothetical protein
MNAKIFSFVRVSDQSIVASVNIARFVSTTLGDIPICWDGTVDDEPLDVLIIVGGAYAFSKGDTLERLGHTIETAGSVIWIQNDYSVIPPKDIAGAESPFRKAFRNRYERTNAPSVSFWTTVEVMSKPGVSPSGHLCGPHSTYINWNVLAFNNHPLRPWDERVAADALLYYGSMRKDREKYFDRYFASPVVSTFFSCPTSKAAERYPFLTHETKIESLMDYLSSFGLGLYLEDRKSHTEFHSPANRFYEMLSAGLPIVFQPECQRMMEKAGFDVSPFILWSPAEAVGMIERREEILTQQREEWLPKVITDRAELTIKLTEAWRKLT